MNPASLYSIISLGAGVLAWVFPRFLEYIIAIYLLLVAGMGLAYG